MKKSLKRLNDWIVDELDDPVDAEIVFDIGLEEYGFPTERPDGFATNDVDHDEAIRYLAALGYKANGMRNLGWALPRAESPIERIFLFHLVYAFWQYDPWLLSAPMDDHIAELAEMFGKDKELAEIRADWLEMHDIERAIVFVPQVVPSEWPEGRAPFDEDDDRLEQLAGIRLDLVLARPAVTDEFLAVELDGYEWHKDNFTKDRKRDRLLRQAGFDVLRYSGSEIVNEPAESARDLMRYCIDKWGDLDDGECEGSGQGE